MKKKYISTSEFKPNDRVWVTGVSFNPSGRPKYIVRPTFVKILQVYPEYIEIDKSKLSYYVPCNYFIARQDPYTQYHRSTLIDTNIAWTKEEAIENFNLRIKEEIEQKYSDFKSFEDRLKNYLL